MDTRDAIAGAMRIDDETAVVWQAGVEERLSTRHSRPRPEDFHTSIEFAGAQFTADMVAVSGFRGDKELYIRAAVLPATVMIGQSELPASPRYAEARDIAVSFSTSEGMIHVIGATASSLDWTEEEVTFWRGGIPTALLQSARYWIAAYDLAEATERA